MRLQSEEQRSPDAHYGDDAEAISTLRESRVARGRSGRSRISWAIRAPPSGPAASSCGASVTIAALRCRSGRSSLAKLPRNLDRHGVRWQRHSAIFEGARSDDRVCLKRERIAICRRKRRQGKLEDGATRHVGGRPQSPAMGFDDGATDRQPHPQAALLGRVEGLKDALEIRRSEPGTGIPHPDQDAVRPGSPGADQQFSRGLAAGAHRFDRIVDQVQEHLLQLDAIPLDGTHT